MVLASGALLLDEELDEDEELLDDELLEEDEELRDEELLDKDDKLLDEDVDGVAVLKPHWAKVFHVALS